MFDLIQFLNEDGWAIAVGARTAGGSPRYAQTLNRLGILTFVGLGPEAETLIAAGRFDVAIASFWYLAEEILPLFRKLSPETRVIVESHDLHFLRNAREGLGPTRPGGTPSLLDERYADETRRELNTYASADAVLAVSQKEADLINDFVGDPDLARQVPDSEDFPPSPLGFNERQGITFVGNFRHPPNRAALKYLVAEILPLVDDKLLRDHPVRIVGNALDASMDLIPTLPAYIRPVGWVPSVVPYIHKARVSVAPLLSGAGTKRKVVQAGLAGTPMVSTTIGVEGLGLEDGTDVLIADDPQAFARSIQQLLLDRLLWERLAQAARVHLESRHGRDKAHRIFREVLTLVMSRPAKKSPVASDDLVWSNDPYRGLVIDVRRIVQDRIPEGATVLVVSRGDDELIRFESRHGWHFPRGEEGGYAWSYPPDSRSAISHLERLRAQGAQYIVFPKTSYWWLDYYTRLKRYLDDKHEVVFSSEACLIYDLSGPPMSLHHDHVASTALPLSTSS